MNLGQYQSAPWRVPGRCYNGTLIESGAPRTAPGYTQDSTKAHPGGNQKAPRTVPGCTQDRTTVHLGYYQGAPRILPGCTQDSTRTYPGQYQDAPYKCLWNGHKVWNLYLGILGNVFVSWDVPGKCLICSLEELRKCVFHDTTGHA